MKEEQMDPLTFTVLKLNFHSLYASKYGLESLHCKLLWRVHIEQKLVGAMDLP